MADLSDINEEQVCQFLEDCMENPEILDLTDCITVPVGVNSADEFCEWFESLSDE